MIEFAVDFTQVFLFDCTKDLLVWMMHHRYYVIVYFLYPLIVNLLVNIFVVFLLMHFIDTFPPEYSSLNQKHSMAWCVIMCPSMLGFPFHIKTTILNCDVR